MTAILMGANYYAKLQLKKALENLEVDNQFSYENVNVNLLIRKATVTGISFENKALSLKTAQAAINGFSYYNYLFSDTLDLGNISLKAPVIILKAKSEPPKDSIAKKKKPLEKTIVVNSLSITDGYLDIFKTETQKSISAHIINFEMTDMVTNDSLMSQKLPFSYVEVSSKMDSVYLSISNDMDLKLESLKIDSNDIYINNLQIIPKYNRTEFQRVIPYEKDLMTLSVPEVFIRQFKITTHNDRLLVQTPEVTLRNLSGNIYRDKNAEDDTRIKPMYSEMLRSLNFGLVIDKLLIVDGDLVYEEVPDGKDVAGKVIFRNLNVDVANASNVSLKAETLPITTLDISTGFMDNAWIKVFWQFNVNNTADYFMIKGTGKHISAADINNFFVPAINVKAVGALHELSFNFSGNVNEAKGDMQIEYDQFSVEILRQGGIKKNRLLTSVANLFIDNNEKQGVVNKDNIVVTRDKTKSFWNYFWLCIRNGALESLTF